MTNEEIQKFIDAALEKPIHMDTAFAILLGKEVLNLREEISNLKYELSDMEDRYYFGDME